MIANKTKKIILGAFLLVVLIGSVSAITNDIPINESFPFPTPEGQLRILSWNIEFLGARDPPRTEEQIKAIAERILTFDAAVMALQEITVISVLEDIQIQLGDEWEIYYADKENVLLYNTSKVEALSLEVLNNLSNPPYTSYPGAYHRRPISGVFAPVGLRTNPFRVIGVHLHWSDVNIRIAEGMWLRNKTVELLETPEETKDIILIGDLNGHPGWPPHPSLQEGNYLFLLPKENGNVTHVNGQSEIDHCYVTKYAKKKIPKQSTFVIRPKHYGETPEQFDETYSDHLPIFVDLNVYSYSFRTLNKFIDKIFGK